MKIKVLRNYGGFNTNEQRILPGVYDSEDPALFGVATYLIEHGHAVYMEAEPIPQAVEPVRSESAKPTDVSPDSTPQPKARKRK